MTIFSHPGFSARIIADSVSPEGHRLTTAEVTFPRSILPEFNTHRTLSRNSASSRAIPVAKQIKKIMANAYVPNTIGVNQSGMQASVYLEGEQLEEAQRNVILKRDRAIVGALEDLVGRKYVTGAFGGREKLSGILLDGFDDEAKQKVGNVLQHYKISLDRTREDGHYLLPDDFLNIHKQTLNRYLEPFMWQTVVVSATEWENFFALRIHTDAQPEICLAAELLKNAMADSTPVLLQPGQWHLPFVQEDEKHLVTNDTIEDWKYISAGRCARVSYETHDGRRDINKDIELSRDRLLPAGHMSPFEHVATPAASGDSSEAGNFDGWVQFRKTIPFESNYGEKIASN